MRLGDLQRSALNMINIIQYTPAFEETLDRLIENSTDADAVAAARSAKDALAQMKADGSVTPPTRPTDPNAPTVTPTVAPTVAPTPEPETPATQGCYVATSVYDSYDCPEVWTLRRFRDEVLAETWYGRLFIHAYYAVSPTAVRLLGDSDWFQTFFRGRLDKMVADLQAKGFASTPYNDPAW